MDRILTDTELKEKGWSIEVLRQEIAAGRLRAKDWGTGFSVTEEAFDEWHSSESGQAISNGFPASGPGPGPARHQHHTSPGGSSGNAWQRFAADLVSKGTPHAIAAAAAEQRHPGGRMDLVRTEQAEAKAKHQRERTEALAAHLARENKTR